ncbi:MAG TPA: type IV pilus twitching motility protein PilT [Actinomycetota bacterium]|nr:type IV pilus twitching motility protein PilT [Actinomycetota bacterium]
MTRAKADALDPLLTELWERNASDLILTVGAPPMLRIDGQLTPLPGIEALQPDEAEALLQSVLPEDMWVRFQRNREIDFSFNWRDLARFRGNAFVQRGTFGLAVRAIPFQIPSFSQLGLPPVTAGLTQLPHGLILVTGPTGCGKSTTLASMLDYINQTRACHILTIEDPIEYVHAHKRCVVNQREVGDDTHSFANALRSALREDPDVLLVGEMRDLESIRIALTVAETGHLVFATLHTNDTSQALDRIVDVFPAEQQQQIRIQLANSLQSVLYQQLIPRIGGGRVAAFEVLLANHAIRNLIKEGKSSQIRNVVVTSQKEGMQTLEAAISDLIVQGVIDPVAGRMRSMFPNEIRTTGPLGMAPPVPMPIPASPPPPVAAGAQGDRRRGR